MFQRDKLKCVQTMIDEHYGYGILVEGRLGGQHGVIFIRAGLNLSSAFMELIESISPAIPEFSKFDQFVVRDYSQFLITARQQGFGVTGNRALIESTDFLFPPGKPVDLPICMEDDLKKRLKLLGMGEASRINAYKAGDQYFCVAYDSLKESVRRNYGDEKLAFVYGMVGEISPWAIKYDHFFYDWMSRAVLSNVGVPVAPKSDLLITKIRSWVPEKIIRVKKAFAETTRISILDIVGDASANPLDMEVRLEWTFFHLVERKYEVFSPLAAVVASFVGPEEIKLKFKQFAGMLGFCNLVLALQRESPQGTILFDTPLKGYQEIDIVSNSEKAVELLSEGALALFKHAIIMPSLSTSEIQHIKAVVTTSIQSRIENSDQQVAAASAAWKAKNVISDMPARIDTVVTALAQPTDSDSPAASSEYANNVLDDIEYSLDNNDDEDGDGDDRSAMISRVVGEEIVDNMLEYAHIEDGEVRETVELLGEEDETLIELGGRILREQGFVPDAIEALNQAAAIEQERLKAEVEKTRSALAELDRVDKSKVFVYLDEYEYAMTSLVRFNDCYEMLGRMVKELAESLNDYEKMALLELSFLQQIYNGYLSDMEGEISSSNPSDLSADIFNKVRGLIKNEGYSAGEIDHILELILKAFRLLPCRSVALPIGYRTLPQLLDGLDDYDVPEWVEDVVDDDATDDVYITLSDDVIDVIFMSKANMPFLKMFEPIVAGVWNREKASDDVIAKINALPNGFGYFPIDDNETYFDYTEYPVEIARFPEKPQEELRKAQNKMDDLTKSFDALRSAMNEYGGGMEEFARENSVEDVTKVADVIVSLLYTREGMMQLADYCDDTMAKKWILRAWDSVPMEDKLKLGLELNWGDILRPAINESKLLRYSAYSHLYEGANKFDVVYSPTLQAAFAGRSGGGDFWHEISKIAEEQYKSKLAVYLGRKITPDKSLLVSRVGSQRYSKLHKIADIYNVASQVELIDYDMGEDIFSAEGILNWSFYWSESPAHFPHVVGADVDDVAAAAAIGVLKTLEIRIPVLALPFYFLDKDQSSVFLRDLERMVLLREISDNYSKVINNQKAVVLGTPVVDTTPTPILFPTPQALRNFMMKEGLLIDFVESVEQSTNGYFLRDNESHGKREIAFYWQAPDTNVNDGYIVKQFRQKENCNWSIYFALEEGRRKKYLIDYQINGLELKLYVPLNCSRGKYAGEYLLADNWLNEKFANYADLVTQSDIVWDKWNVSRPLSESMSHYCVVPDVKVAVSRKLCVVDRIKDDFNCARNINILCEHGNYIHFVPNDDKVKVYHGIQHGSSAIDIKHHFPHVVKFCRSII